MLADLGLTRFRALALLLFCQSLFASIFHMFDWLFLVYLRPNVTCPKLIPLIGWLDSLCYL